MDTAVAAAVSQLYDPPHCQVTTMDNPKARNVKITAFILALVALAIYISFYLLVANR